MDRPRYAPTHDWPPTTGPLAGSLGELGDRVNGLPDWLNGRYVTVEASLGAPGTVYTAHGLGRQWRGAWIVSNSAASVPAQVAAPDASRPYEFGVYFTAAVSATLRVWVF